jgi:hypothetical protein
MAFARRSVVLSAALGALVLGTARGARGDDDPAVQRAVGFLKARAGSSQVGETGLIVLALLKADVPPGDPAVAAGVARLRRQFLSGGYTPDRRGGHDVYEAAVVSLALANLTPESRRAELEMVAQYLVGKQKANGSWDYDGRDKGDTSISQYAVLGLWEAENGGARVPPRVWDNAAEWFMSVQASGGSWNYHRDESHPETVSMTAAGVGSLLICQRQLNKARRGFESASSLLTPVLGEAQRERYEPATANARIDQAARRGMAWLAANFTTNGGDPIIGQSAYYGLYGIERIGALAGRQNLGRVDWFEQGSRMIRATQRGDGAWDASHGDIANTAWAVLFITKSTAKTLRRIEIKSLGAGTLLGGRGLPKDLSNLTVAGGRVVSRPMNGAVEGMLAVLQDPRAENADGALSGLVDRYRAEGAAAIRPYKDRFLAMQKDRDPGVRKVAAWALARTGDMDVVPALIAALTDPDESVVSVARDGLKLLSRKAQGYGPPTPSTPAQRAEAAQRWRAWFATIRPLDLEGQDEAPAPAAAVTGRNPQ